MKQKLTQRIIAEALGVRVQTVSDWKNGRHTPKLSPRQTAVLCDLLQVSVAELAEMFPDSDQRGKSRG